MAGFWHDDRVPEATLEFSVAGVTEADVVGFFVGWPNPPSPAERLAILRAADEVVVARDGDGQVVGFAAAITDGRFAAYIPLVEVLPDHQRTGIGSRLVLALLDRVRAHYMIDLACDEMWWGSTSDSVAATATPSFGATTNGSVLRARPPRSCEPRPDAAPEGVAA